MSVEGNKTILNGSKSIFTLTPSVLCRVYSKPELSRCTGLLFVSMAGVSDSLCTTLYQQVNIMSAGMTPRDIWQFFRQEDCAAPLTQTAVRVRGISLHIVSFSKRIGTIFSQLDWQHIAASVIQHKIPVYWRKSWYDISGYCSFSSLLNCTQLIYII